MAKGHCVTAEVEGLTIFWRTGSACFIFQIMIVSQNVVCFLIVRYIKFLTNSRSYKYIMYYVYSSYKYIMYIMYVMC